LLESHGGVATSGELLRLMSRRRLQTLIDTGVFTRLWPGVYCAGEPTFLLRLRGLDIRVGHPVAVCLGTAAAIHGFDTEDTADIHVLNPPGHLLRGGDGLVVHRRNDVPLVMVDGRRVAAPAWTAVEVARGLRRPRALATLDAALRSGTCGTSQLAAAAREQWRRRGIVNVRSLIPLAIPHAESPMESEARLVMYDRCLPPPVCQFEIVDLDGELWRVDFAWPEEKLAVEYDGYDWHSGPEEFRRDHRKRAALAELGWRVISITADDVRIFPAEMVRRIERELVRAAA